MHFSHTLHVGRKNTIPAVGLRRTDWPAQHSRKPSQQYLSFLTEMNLISRCSPITFLGVFWLELVRAPSLSLRNSLSSQLVQSKTPKKLWGDHGKLISFHTVNSSSLQRTQNNTSERQNVWYHFWSTATDRQTNEQWLILPPLSNPQSSYKYGSISGWKWLKWWNSSQSTIIHEKIRKSINASNRKSQRDCNER